MEITSFSIAINMMSTELGGIVCNKDDKQVRTVLMLYTLKLIENLSTLNYISRTDVINLHFCL